MENKDNDKIRRIEEEIERKKGNKSAGYQRCSRHGIEYPHGSGCPACAAERRK